MIIMQQLNQNRMENQINQPFHFFLSQTRIFDIKLINTEDFLQLVFRFGLNLLITFIIVYMLYA